MKKMFLILLAMPLVFSLAACSSGNPVSREDTSSEPSVSSSEASSVTSESSVDAEVPASGAPSSQEEESAEDGATLVAYFSWSGNTRQMAEIIAQETDADLFEISTVTPYTDDYNELLDIAQQEQSEAARPELDAQVENWDSYDTIFIGFPNWWSDAPMAVYTFLESYDFNGKTLIPFNTSASGGFGRSLSGISESVSGTTMLDGLDLTESELGDAQSRITIWLNELGLIE